MITFSAPYLGETLHKLSNFSIVFGERPQNPPPLLCSKGRLHTLMSKRGKHALTNNLLA